MCLEGLEMPRLPVRALRRVLQGWAWPHRAEPQVPPLLPPVVGNRPHTPGLKRGLQFWGGQAKQGRAND